MSRRVAIACVTESFGAKVITCVDKESLTFSDFTVSHYVYLVSARQRGD